MILLAILKVSVHDKGEAILPTLEKTREKYQIPVKQKHSLPLLCLF